jgi:hypothetical protein
MRVANSTWPSSKYFSFSASLYFILTFTNVLTFQTRFFERIAKTYRTEHWTELLRPALALWYDCARHLADIELSLRVLAEMLVPGEYASHTINRN